MKILHVVPTYLPATRYGGPIYSVHALCRALAAAGHEVHVVTTSVDGSGDSDVPHDRPVDLDGVQVHYFRSRVLRRLYFSAGLWRQLQAGAGGFDAVHLHSVFLWPTVAGARAATAAGVPYVLSPRGMLVKDLIERRSAMLKKSWIALVERGNLMRAAAIHVTSQEEKRALEEIGLALAPVAIVPNGVDPPGPFEPGEVSDDVRVAVAGGFDILSFGRINWKKGLDRLIEAVAAIPGATAVVAGHDEDGEAAKLRQQARDRGVADRVRFLDRQIGGADREALFKAARLFALPSLSENFGNVVVEAMVRGVPVVVTDGVGASEVVAASGGGLVAANTQDAFTAALRQALGAPERLDAMGAAGAAYARSQLTWAGVAQRLEALYGEIAGRRVGRSCSTT